MLAPPGHYQDSKVYNEDLTLEEAEGGGRAEARPSNLQAEGTAVTGMG